MECSCDVPEVSEMPSGLSMALIWSFMQSLWLLSIFLSRGASLRKPAWCAWAVWHFPSRQASASPSFDINSLIPNICIVWQRGVAQGAEFPCYDQNLQKTMYSKGDCWDRIISAPSPWKWNKKWEEAVSETKRNTLHAKLTSFSTIFMQLYLIKILMNCVFK